jgi:hypothetical protein
MRDGVEMVGWVVLEDASMDPVVGFESGADDVCGGRGWQRVAVDEDGEGGVGDVGCGLIEPVCFGRRCHVRRISGGVLTFTLWDINIAADEGL